MTTSRSARALLVSGGLALAVSVVPLVAAPLSAAPAEPGSALGAFSMSASAPAVQVRQQEPNYCYATVAAQNGCELVLPEAVSTLRRGPIGKAVAAVVWPGALAADIGSLLITASDGRLPDEARMLNDPVRAEAQTSTGPEKVTYDEVPGTLMVATAKDVATSAEASVSSTQVTPVGTFGKTTGTSSSVLSGPKKAIATAHSSVQDVSLAGGVIQVGSVTSDAVATTDGVKASAKGTTVATGITIAGVPVTVDDRGITVQGQGVALTAATVAVNTAVNQLGIVMVAGAPAGMPQGSGVTYNAGSLVILWKQTTGYATTVTLGGVNVSVDAAPALDFSVPGVPTSPVDSGPPPVDSGTVQPGSTPPLDTGSVSAPTLPESAAPPVTAPVTAGAAPVLASRRVALPEGLSPWLGAFGVLGAGLVMAGLRRLPDRLLAPTTPECLLEENR